MRLLGAIKLLIQTLKALLKGIIRMTTALENLDASIAKLTGAVNNAAAKINDQGANTVPATEVQSRADQIDALATGLQTAVDNNTTKA